MQNMLFVHNTRQNTISVLLNLLLRGLGPLQSYTSNVESVYTCIKFKDIYCPSCIVCVAIYASLGTVKHISIHIQRRSKMKSDPDRLCVTVEPVALLAQPRGLMSHL